MHTGQLGTDGDYTDGGIDAGLLILSVTMPPVGGWTQADIAYVCGCSQGYIYYLKRIAKKKLKAELERRGIDKAIYL